MAYPQVTTDYTWRMSCAHNCVLKRAKKEIRPFGLSQKAKRGYLEMVLPFNQWPFSFKILILNGRPGNATDSPVDAKHIYRIRSSSLRGAMEYDCALLSDGWVAVGERRRNNIRTSMLRLFQWNSEAKSLTMMGYTISPTLKLVRHHWIVLRCLLVSSPSPNPLVPKPPKSCPIQVLLDHFPQYLGLGLSSWLSNMLYME